MARTRRVAAPTPATTSDNVVTLPVASTPEVPAVQEDADAKLRHLLANANPGQLTKTFLTIRAEIKKMEATIDILKHRQGIVSTMIMQKMQELGEDGFQAEGHTVYQYTLQSWAVQDKEVFRHYVTNIEGGLDLVDFRPNKEACDTFANEYGEPPDGAVRNEFLKLGVRKV